MASIHVGDIPFSADELSSATGEEKLKETFSQWDLEKLIAYAVSTTQALSSEQEALKDLTTQYNSAQNWALGLALVEEIGRSLASTLDLEEVLTQLLSRTYSAIDVEDGSVLLIEEPSGDLVTQVILGSLAKSTKPFRVPRGQGIAGKVAETGIPIIVNNAEEDPRHFKQIDEDTGFHTRSILCVPLLTRDKIIGVLEVFNKKTGTFTEQDQLLLSYIANYAGIAIENARLHERVIAERDRVVKAQEEVSHRLQRDLHDGPTQLVAAIQMSIDFCTQAIQHNEIDMATNELQNVLELAHRANHQMRTLLFELRPLVLESEGLVAALEVFQERRQEEIKPVILDLICKSDLPDNQISRMEAKVEASLFAVVQEAVNNATKYANAETISMLLEQNGDTLTITVKDDGDGFDVSSVTQNYESRGSYGMVNLRERVEVANGEYVINSTIGQGTEVIVSVPISPPKA